MDGEPIRILRLCGGISEGTLVSIQFAASYSSTRILSVKNF